MTRAGRAGVAALFLTAATIFVARFVGAERTVYFWDFNGFWPRTLELRAILASAGPAALLAQVRDSVRIDEYNALPALLLLPAMAVFGAGRLGYVLAVVLTFAVPSVLLFERLVRALVGRDTRTGGIATIVALATITFVPQYWLPILVGYLDVAGCVVMFGILLLARRMFGAPARDLRAGIALGVLLALLALTRRWYGYWAVAFFPAAALAAGFVGSRDSHPGTGRSRPAFAVLSTLAVAGVVAGATLAAVAGPASWRMLTVDYATIYSAYRSTGSPSAALAHLAGHFGLLLPGLALVGAAVALFDPDLRAMAILLLAQALLVLLSFHRTQDMGWQHAYLLLPALLVFACVVVTRAVASLPAGVARSALLATYVGALGLGFLAMLEPVVGSRTRFLEPAVSGLVYGPLRRTDLDELGRLVAELDRLVRERPGARVYVLSSSTVLNDEILRLAKLSQPEWPDLGPIVLRTSHLDLRDGFPADLARADYVVLTEPVGLHLRPGDQRVVVEPALRLREGRGIGRAFSPRDGPFALEGGVEARILERVAPIRGEDLEELAKAIAAAHPGAPFKAPPPPTDLP